MDLLGWTSEPALTHSSDTGPTQFPERFKLHVGRSSELSVALIGSFRKF